MFTLIYTIRVWCTHFIKSLPIKYFNKSLTCNLWEIERKTFRRSILNGFDFFHPNVIIIQVLRIFFLLQLSRNLFKILRVYTGFRLANLLYLTCSPLRLCFFLHIYIYMCVCVCVHTRAFVCTIKYHTPTHLNSPLILKALDKSFPKSFGTPIETFDGIYIYIYIYIYI